MKIWDLYKHTEKKRKEKEEARVDGNHVRKVVKPLEKRLKKIDKKMEELETKFNKELNEMHAKLDRLLAMVEPSR